jgi:hypothetical protein
MSENLDSLYDLLPVIHRQRDAEMGYPLKALLRVVGRQVDVVESDITRLYENWFIETCEDWVVPYVGDLVGYRPVHEAGQPGDVTTLRQRQRNKILCPRREVAKTVYYRRRKGTLALLEELANDVAGWPARAVEFYRLLGINQAVNHHRLPQGRTLNLCDGGALDLLDGPFDGSAHTVDVRRIASHRTPGRYNVPNLGLFVFRLKAYSVSKAPAYCLESVGQHCFTFSALGNDVPLFTNPKKEDKPTDIAGELNLPVPIRRRAFEERVVKDGKPRTQASAAYYGRDEDCPNSLLIWAKNWGDSDAGRPIPRERIIPADLTAWQYQPPTGYVAVDPTSGRIAFPPGQRPKDGVWVTYHHGFSADVGGGEYERQLSQPAQAIVYRVGDNGDFAEIRQALAQWEADADEWNHAVIEITDGGVYVEPVNIEIKANHSLQIRAASGKRPVIRLLDWQTDRPDALRIRGEAGSRFTLDGLLVAGRPVQVEGELKKLTIRHCTLVPGWTLDHPVRLHDCILDATCNEQEALGAPGCLVAHVVLDVARSTVFGQIHTHAIDLAQNSIFMGPVRVAHRQRGCMRFCYVTPGSRTPRRYRCQPDLAGTAVDRQRLPVRPRFDSIRYGTPTYCRLAETCAEEITRGADDESEMGVFHDLYQPQRAANLQARLEEYTPAGANVGIIYAT